MSSLPPNDIFRPSDGSCHFTHGVSGRTKELAVYLEIGLNILKFGDEALLDLSSFSLVGAASQNFRTALDKPTNDGPK